MLNNEYILSVLYAIAYARTYYDIYFIDSTQSCYTFSSFFGLFHKSWNHQLNQFNWSATSLFFVIVNK